MPNPSADLSRVFRALADATRRTVLERLGRGPATVGELAKAFDMALPSFLQHLDVLVDAGLVESEKNGRVRTCKLKANRNGSLNLAQGWMQSLSGQGDRRADQLDAYLKRFSNAQGLSQTKPQTRKTS